MDQHQSARESICTEAGRETQIDLSTMILEEPLKRKQVLEGAYSVQQLHLGMKKSPPETMAIEEIKVRNNLHIDDDLECVWKSCSL